MSGIDFLVVGAQKSGTTSLHEYASKHPQIFLPKGKEAPFFNREEYYEKGVDFYLQKTFPSVKDPGELWGKISPQYMCNKAVAERIFDNLPDVKIIALLRDPVKRAISHYNMACKRGLEKRGINQAFSDSLDAANIDKARSLISRIENETSCYVVWSEYGRILDYYLELYKNPPAVFYFEDMVDDPADFIRNFFACVGVNEEILPSNLGEKVFSGDGGRMDLMKSLREFPLFKRIWRVLPVNVRSELYFFVEQFLSKAPPFLSRRGDVNASSELSEDMIARLREHFNNDIESSVSVNPHAKWCL